MIKNVPCHPVRSRRRFLIGACLLAALTALPALAAQNLTIKLGLNASFNGYTVEASADGTEVSCVGVRAGTDKTSPVLNGSYEVTVTLSNKKQLARSVEFTNGKAAFGAVGPSGTKVNTVAVIAPGM